MRTVTTGSKLHDVWLAIRDGGGLTLTEIAAKTGYPGVSVAPMVAWLCHRDWVVPLQAHTPMIVVRNKKGGYETLTEGRIYLSARHARHLIGATRREQRIRY